MPRPGESPLARFAHAIAAEDGFSFGEPQRSDDGSVVILPVLRTDPPDQGFVLASELPDRISAEDVGRLDWLRVRNEGDTRVFLPPGTLFEGRGTATRGVCAGATLEPGSVRDLRVRCVQAAQPIRGGTRLRVVQVLAPPPLAQALASMDQGLVWAVMASSDVPRAEPRRDGAPSSAIECGRIRMDADGVVAAEICDHPDIWLALSRAWSPTPSTAPRLALDPSGAVDVARAFFGRLLQRTYYDVGSGSSVAADASAVCTVDRGRVVHLLAFGRDLAAPSGDSGTPQAFPDPAFGPPSESLAAPSFLAASSADAGATVAVPVPQPEAEEDGSLPAPRPRRRKVLTSGWDGPTFQSLEHLSRKEFRGDRSAAIRFLVRQGLRHRGYLGPQPRIPPPPTEPAEDEAAPDGADLPSAAEARLLDLERIAATDAYAGWLRKRARLELERLASAASKAPQTSAAQAALLRLPIDPPPEEAPEEAAVPEVREAPAPVAPPSPPPVDARPLLRRAFAASAAARYPEALALFDDVLRADPENRTALLGRAVALKRSGKSPEALDALDVVLRLEPGNAAALLHRGRLLMERGDLAAALEAFELLAAAAPNDWDVWMARGDLLAKMGREQDALQAYHEARRRNPDDEGLAARIRELEQAKPAPVPPAVQRIQLPREVQEGQTYLVKEAQPDLSLRILQALAARSVPALVLTRRPVEALRSDARLAAARIVELSHAPGEGHEDPTALGALTSLLDRFVRLNGGHGIIVLDGLSSLVLENGFRETALFIERVNETVQQSQAVFLLSVAAGDLSEREEALLERNLRTLA